ncbi:DNA-3-methyladenine glycosylase II [Paenibacillus phyllosphaerae]|uniref:DNA-3-methyladenine glycosylase II n=1 Tax=Paenibacillus phyllosphaerae TaxID=274593 RepID=A0A7W5AYN3_9BACL|nr:DNA-3-methyladenine glycosylase 2 family protein [Paenibacillus phyllosphaerae]MBB3111184.1 DNA-3-methyladenine glycosylase II [Paenibacillus phyllosphaerae]
MGLRFEYGQEEIEYLSAADPVLARAIVRLGRVDRPIQDDVFKALIHAVVGQLISAKAADTIWGRMQTAFGELSAATLAAQDAEKLQRCGMTMRKSSTIHQLAQLVASGEVKLEGLAQLSDSEVIRELTLIKGIGPWTAEMVLLHALQRKDIVSWGDIAIRRGMMKLYGLQTLTQSEFTIYRSRYSPHGSVASIYLWELATVEEERWR